MMAVLKICFNPLDSRFWEWFLCQVTCMDWLFLSLTIKPPTDYTLVTGV
jgi:hypothetical protein